MLQLHHHQGAQINALPDDDYDYDYDDGAH